MPWKRLLQSVTIGVALGAAVGGSVLAVSSCQAPALGAVVGALAGFAGVAVAFINEQRY